MKQEQIEALRGLEAKATPAPWDYTRVKDEPSVWRIAEEGPMGYVLMSGQDSPLRDDNEGDRLLTVAARNALPQLLAEREALLGALRAMAKSAHQSEQGAALEGKLYWITPQAVYAPAEAAIAKAES